MIHDVHILIPVYNEESKISEVILELKQYFKNIVVVNDGSSDSSLDVLNQLDVVVINHLLNLGQGAAISTGINFFKNLKNVNAVITFDADGQHSVEDAVAFAREITICKEDIIFGSRFLKHKMNIPPLKRFVLSTVTFITNKITKMNLTDSHNGLKAYKIDLIKDMQIDIDGFAFESEIISIISKNNIAYKEMPTNTIYTEYSKNKGQKLRNGLIIIEDIYKSIKLR
jgi:glycosyltransferase involved in cell wall biosynthesis